MKTNSILALLVFIFLGLMNYGCKKNNLPKNILPNGMIALSFDDRYVDNWYNYLPLLDSLDIKATFYISGYHTLTVAQKQKLRVIESHGNEIAYHTTNHTNLLKDYTRNGIQSVLKSEIQPDLLLMKADGFDVVNFAYPYGQHDTNLDNILLTYFKSVRAVCNTKNYSKAIVNRTGASQVFYSPRIDSKSNIKEEEIRGLLQIAKDRHTCVMLYTHAINSPDNNFQISLERLKNLSIMAKELNLEFVTVASITK